MAKVPRQAPGYRISVATGSSAGSPSKQTKSSEFARFEELATKLVQTPKPKKN
jgi:hypothetical protein